MAVNFLNHDKHFEMSNGSCVRGYQVERGHVMNFKAETSDYEYTLYIMYIESQCTDTHMF